MSRAINILNVKQINSLGKGRHADGGGLYLLVKNAGTRSWVFRYTRDGKTTDIGLGSASGALPVSLKQAREKAAKCRDDIANGKPPQARRQSQSQIVNRPDDQTMPTFRECAKEYVPIHCHNLRNKKHEAQWLSSLEKFTFAEIGDKDFTDINRSDIIEVLQKSGTTFLKQRGECAVALSEFWIMHMQNIATVMQHSAILRSMTGA